MTELELYLEPRIEALKKIPNIPNEPEMSEFDSSFLCGLIRKRLPKKIVEVGVAAGGTTAIILQCLALLNRNENCEVYSVDLCEMFYRGKGERTGFLAEELKKNLVGTSFKHKFLLGKYLPKFINDIGNDIDFLILDTIHALPGEILDFLAILPYLAPNACVILHDIANNHYGRFPDAFATQVLFDSITAEKCLVLEHNGKIEYPNIGAFFINDNTKTNIIDCFNALSITWNYCIEKDVFDIYRQLYEKHYGDEHIKIFDLLYDLQVKTISKRISPQKKPFTTRIIDFINQLRSRMDKPLSA